MFDTMEDCHQKLASTLVIRGNEPFLVDGAVSHNVVRGGIPGNTTRTEVPLAELNIKHLAPMLGYINVDTYSGCEYKEAIYMMRQAVRRVHQGLNYHNVWCSSLKGDGSPDRPVCDRVIFDRPLWSDNVKALSATIQNKFPTFLEVKGEMSRDKKVTSRAFARNWAVERDPVGPFYLVYKTQRVGYTEDFNRVVMVDRFKFLREDLKEMKACA